MIAAFFAILLWQAPGAEALNELATRQVQANHVDEAEKLWKQAIAASPDFFPAIFNLAFLYSSTTRHAQAEPLLDRAAKLRPGNFNTHYLLGAARTAMGKRDAALLAWRSALAIQPRNTKLLQVMAVEYGKGGYFQEALRSARQALEISPMTLDTHLIGIKAAQDAGDHRTAAEIAERAASSWPESARANFEFSFQLYKSGRPAQAVQYLKKAMAFDSAYEEPFYFYGDTLLNEGRYAEAIEYLSRAIAIKPEYTAAAVALARAYMESGKYEEAVTQLKSAIAKSPRHPAPHLMLSRVYFRMGEEARAREARETSVRLRREDASLMEAPQAKPFPAR